MSNSNMSNDSVTSNRTRMFFIMAVVAGLIFVLANTISTKPEIVGTVMNALIPAANAAALDGKTVYDSGCSACHATGVAGAPKVGDKAAWKARIAAGNQTLYKNSIDGFKGKSGVMPPKGGLSNLSDAEVKAAVDYMVKSSK